MDPLYCLNFKVLYYLFHGLVFLALGLVFTLFSTYQKSGQNVLLRSLCCVMMVSLVLIECGYWFLGKEPYNHEGFQDFSIIQAIVLNYCFICAQAHSACMMVNNCLLALGWRFGEWEKLMDRSLLFLCLSYGIPIIPTFILGVMIPEYAKDVTFPFFSFVPANLMFACCTFWLLICAIPGNIATIYLMYKTINLRNQTLEMTSYSQISRMQVFRLFVAMIIYIFISLGSAIPLLIINPDLYQYPDNYLGSSALKSPWTNMKLCCPYKDDDARLLYFSRVRCPGTLSFLPALMGLGVFLMYGFGTPMRSAFRQISILTGNVLKRPKRRMSAIVDETNTDTEGEYEVRDSRLPAVEEESEEDPTDQITPIPRQQNRQRSSTRRRHSPPSM